MLKTFVTGLVLGIAVAIAAVIYVPVVDQYRERSIITVAPNGGNIEAFHVNVPIDRIMIGAPGQSEPLPAGLDWPQDEELAGLRAELFKIRNSSDVVVGLASRMAAADAEKGSIIEWVLHLPARGSAYISMLPQVAEEGFRTGELRAGTREYAGLQGRVVERWIAAPATETDEDSGRIELMTTFVGKTDAPL